LPFSSALYQATFNPSAKVVQKLIAAILHFFELCFVFGPPILTLKRRQLAELDKKEEYS
jgi:hypothetical protein